MRDGRKRDLTLTTNKLGASGICALHGSCVIGFWAKRVCACRSSASAPGSLAANGDTIFRRPRPTPSSTRRRNAASTSLTPPNVTATTFPNGSSAIICRAATARAGLSATKFGHHFNSFMNRDGRFFRGLACRHSSKLRSRRCASRRLTSTNFIPARTNCFRTKNSGRCWRNKNARAKSATSAFPFCSKGSELQAREAAKFGAEALQVFYNRLDRRPEQIYFPHAQRDNLGILARVPLASGLLTGKYKPGATFAANDVRATFDAEKMKRDLAEVGAPAKRGSAGRRADGEWAMAWCLKNPIVSTLIPGCKNPEQVRANASAAELL